MRYGTLSPENLATLAKEQGAEAVVLTDINNTSASFDFVAACEARGIRPVIGIEFRQKGRLLYTGIARNRDGFRELNEILTRCSLENSPLPQSPPPCNNAFFVFAFRDHLDRKLADNEYIGVRLSDLNHIVTKGRHLSQEKLVAQQPVTFANKEGYQLHRALRAVDNNILLSRLQPYQHAAPDEWLHSKEELIRQYRRYPYIIGNTEQLLGECSFDTGEPGDKNKHSYTGDRARDREMLRQLAFDGITYRYGKHHPEATRRVERELGIVDELNYCTYFLITWDIVRFARSKGYHHVGRGSGANSIVAYCLGITDVDPIELDLYFERFINKHRSSPPDFDVDFSWDERDTVLKYIFRKYGSAHVALLGAYNTFKGKSIVRELGKVFGLPKPEIDAIIAAPDHPNNRHKIADTIVTLGRQLQNFPNYLSIHAGGVLITERPVTNYTALQLMPKGFPITHFDMYVAEDVGLHKYDILSQRGLGHIKDAADIVEENRDLKIDVHNVPAFKRDPLVRALLQTGNTIGCFYIESPAMRGLLRKLRCDNYVSLVAASSIIRPGVAKSGMMRAYIERFHQPDSFTYLHPVMEKQLSETYGIMIYQEDVIKVAHHFAGLDLADADVLRRAMSGKTRSKKELQQIVDKFFSNCAERGYPEELTKEVWRQIESFSGYSFSKAHSASFAVESYQSLYLKAHFPIEFMVAVINNFGGFYPSEIYFHEARKWGAFLQAPCVNHSKRLTSIEGRVVYTGFIHIQHLENTIARDIVQERYQNGPYEDLDDFINRVSMSLEQLCILIRVGAFRFTGISKKELLWAAHLRMNKGKRYAVEHLLFREPAQNYNLPNLTHTLVEDLYDEIELLGFTLFSPFDLLRTSFRGEVKAKDLTRNVGKTVRMTGYLVVTKNVITVKKERMKFGTFLDSDGDFFDTTHFPDSLKRYPFRGKGIYLLKGVIAEEFGYATLEVNQMARLPFQVDPRAQ